MGLGDLTTRSAAQAVDHTWWNTIQDAIKETFVGRNSSGVATAGQDLGSSTYPWGRIYANDLVLDGALVDVSAVSNNAPYKIISGKVRTTSNQPSFLTPAGAAGGRSVTISASVTSLVYQVQDTTTTLSSNIVISALTAAPSSNNTCLINNSTLSGQTSTRSFGESYANHFAAVTSGGGTSTLTVDTMGSEISALVGKRAAFKLTHSGTDEYFTAVVQSTTVLADCYRGFFYNSSLAPINPVVISDNDVITLMKLAWLFLDVDGSTTDVTYNEPVYSGTQPSSPASGDYWYDIANSQWKRYNGTTYVSVDRLFIGQAICNTADCIGARCADFFANYKSDLNIKVSTIANASATMASSPSMVSVAGNPIVFNDLKTWTMSTDFATSADMNNSSEQASTLYFFYVTDQGALKISDIYPYFRGDLLGWYHPHNPWRAVATVYNNGSSNLETTLNHGYYPSMVRSNLEFGTADLADSSITNIKAGAANLTESSASGTVTGTGGGSAANIDTTISFTTVGRPVRVTIYPNQNGSESYFRISGSNAPNVAKIRILRDSVTQALFRFTSDNTETKDYPSTISWVDTEVLNAPGTYGYLASVEAESAGSTAVVENVKVCVEEIK